MTTCNVTTRCIFIFVICNMWDKQDKWVRRVMTCCNCEAPPPKMVTSFVFQQYVPHLRWIVLIWSTIKKYVPRYWTLKNQFILFAFIIKSKNTVTLSYFSKGMLLYCFSMSNVPSALYIILRIEEGINSAKRERKMKRLELLRIQLIQSQTRSSNLNHSISCTGSHLTFRSPR